MSDYITRMKDERTELNTKFTALCEFMLTDNFMRLSKNANRLLRQQREVMFEYLTILACRIELAETEPYVQVLNETR